MMNTEPFDVDQACKDALARCHAHTDGMAAKVHKWMARDFAHTREMMERRYQDSPASVNSVYTMTGSVGISGLHYTTYIQLAGRAVIEVDSSNVITKLDLPFIVWTWLRLSAPARFLRALWVGERGLA